jgi:hypothetical protein
MQRSGILHEAREPPDPVKGAPLLLAALIQAWPFCVGHAWISHIQPAPLPTIIVLPRKLLARPNAWSPVRCAELAWHPAPVAFAGRTKDVLQLATRKVVCRMGEKDGAPVVRQGLEQAAQVEALCCWLNPQQEARE